MTQQFNDEKSDIHATVGDNGVCIFYNYRGDAVTVPLNVWSVLNDFVREAMEDKHETSTE